MKEARQYKKIRTITRGRVERVNPKALAPIEDTRGKSKGKFGGLKQETIIEMAKDKAAGATDDELSEQYGISISLLQQALRGLYINTQIGREILKKVYLENALIFGMDARTKIKDMTGVQSAVASGIFATKLNELEKTDRERPNNFDAKELNDALADLKELNDIVKGDDAED